MGKFVIRDASLTIGGVDLSDHVQSVTVNYGADTPEKTSMGDDTHLMMGGGLKNWSIDVTFLQDFAANEVDDTLFAMVGTEVTVVVKPTSDAVSSTNPSYTGTGLIASYNPIGNSVGEAATAPVNIMSAGTLTRATS